MRRLTHIAILIASLLAAPLMAVAAESQFYFVGKVVVSSDPVPGARHIYLRWDPIEGQLPPDVVKVSLRRNGAELERWTVGTVMGAARINGLYRGADHQRRKLETITRLNELLTQEGTAFSASDFSNHLHALLNPALEDTYNPLWAFLGSRTDFNIARARHRAWIDTAPVTVDELDVVQYELVGIDASDNEARLGYVEIDPTSSQSILGAEDFYQVRVTDWRCDLPEGSKDHYTVMLDWESPGTSNIADRVAAQASTSGFDLYRSSDNLGPTEDPPQLDIAALAAAASYDSRGRPLIDGLEKVNVPLIIDAGARAVDSDWAAARQYHLERVDGDVQQLPAVPEGNVPYEPRWVEARDQLMRAGLQPGDRRAYYLVPRDFTGAYGPTTATLVQVPLMTRPPAPWNLRDFADETSSVLGSGPDALTITWDEVDLDNYIDYYQGTRLFCNTVEARSTGVLEYVPADGDCALDPRNAVRLDVRDYRIYRFENFDLAGRFKDSDGDGVSDSDETPDFDGDKRYDAFERSAGLQCNSLEQPPGAQSFLQYAVGAGSINLQRPSLLNPNAPSIARMRDTVPAGEKDTVFWYRIVSEAGAPGPSSRFSFMSAPQRGMFPDRTPPPDPTFTLTRPEPTPEGCAVTMTPDVPWSFDETVLDDPKDTFTVSCGADTFDVTAAQLSSANTQQCQDIAAACNGDAVTLQSAASSRTGKQGCDDPVSFDAENQFCVTGAVQVDPGFVDFDTAITPGELVTADWVGAAYPPPDDERGSYCVTVFETIDGTSSRLGSTCDSGGLPILPRPGLFCGYAVATDENNNFSRTVQFPCFLSAAQPKAPSPPQILTLDVDETLARYTIRLPAERTAVVLARLEHDSGHGETTGTMDTVPVIDNEGGEAIALSIPVTPPDGGEDRFCLSVMSVGRDTGAGVTANSEWSSETCFTRTSTGEDTPQYLPWPSVDEATVGSILHAALITDEYDIPPFLAIRLGSTFQDIVEGTGQELTQCWRTPPENSEKSRRTFDDFACWEGGRASIKTFLDSRLRFIVYRQSRYLGGEASDWIQVSPFIDYVHFDREIVKINDYDLGLYTLNDPFIRIKEDVGGPPNSVDVLFVDRYPFRLSFDDAGAQPYEWRYQLVYFDTNNLPVEYRISNWIREGQL